MKKLTLFFLFSLCCFAAVQAQPIAVNNTLGNDALVQTLAGPGVVISNITVNAHPGAYGQFTQGGNGSPSIGLEKGVLLTSGSIQNAVGPNDNYPSNGSVFNNWAGHPLLSTMAGDVSHDATVIEFDVVLSGTTLGLKYVFGSDEYHEYVNEGFNDVFGIFISGPGINGIQSLSTGLSGPISIDNVNFGRTSACTATGPSQNGQHFVENCNGGAVKYDGFTKVMQAIATDLHPCETYHLILAISDIKDYVKDSGVFLGEGSLMASGNTDFEMSIACSDNGGWSVTATALSNTVTNNVWELWATTVPGATTGGTLVGTITGGLTATFSSLDLSRYYYIRHVSTLCRPDFETRYVVPDFTRNATVSFEIENAAGAATTEFCVGQAIFLDGTASANYDRFYLSAGRRPIGSAPGTPFSGYADYGWTIDNSIGVLNLTQEFLNNGQNPGEVFQSGYEYEILLAIANPPNCIPWMELKKTFTVVCCDVDPDFTVQSDCNNGNWSVTATPVSNAQTQHVWQLYETSTPGVTTGGAPVGPAQNGATASFSGLDHSKYYYIKHSTGYPGCDILVERVAVHDFRANANLTYVFQDRNGMVKDNFCYGEDIFLNATGASNYDRYFMSVWRRPNGSNGSFDYYGDYGWTFTNNIGTINLSKQFRAHGLNPGEIFEPGYVYELQFAIANPENCIPWIELKKQFRVVCCEDFFSAFFRLDLLDGPNGLELAVRDFQSYTHYATHQWWVLSSPNPDGGPYTYVTQSITDVSPTTLYYEGVAGLYYFVVHRVKTPCGDYCYGQQREGINFHGGGGTSADGGATTVNSDGDEADGDGENPDCELCREIDCSVIEELCYGPGNVRVYGTHSGHLTAYWNAVPGADHYLVEVILNNPACCDNGQPTISATFITTNLSYFLGQLDDECFSLRIGARCEDDVQWSELNCLSADGLAGGGQNPDGASAFASGDPANQQTLLLYPNPANTRFNVVLPKGETVQQIRLIDMQGRLVFEQQQPDQRTEIDCESLPAGIYAIQVIYADHRQTMHKVQISH